MATTSTKPKVSVCVLAYNQDKYIRQCLQSIVDQDTDFGFDVIVAEDCSTDRTREIVQEFSRTYPGIVVPIYNEQNIGPFRNYRLVHSTARGEYVAHVDGDDCLLPGKLSKQSHFLDQHPECHLVAHQVKLIDHHGQIYSTSSNSPTIDLTTLLRAHPMFLNSSTMYRKDTVGDIFYSEVDFIDFYVYVHAATLGYIGFINEALGMYRRNVGLSRKRDLMPYIQQAIDLAATKAPDGVIREARSRQYLSYAIASLHDGYPSQFNEFISLAWTWNKRDPLIYSLFHLQGMHPLIRHVIGFYKKANSLRMSLRAW